ncbi:MAG: hypothetical protein E7212_12895 [Clostridium sartagoforme]|nr:hypothetical protein [Clostridium sartagoforme]
MFAIGESINNTAVNNDKNTIEFEKYCKSEGLSSIQIRREIYILYIIKKIDFIKKLLGLVK